MRVPTQTVKFYDALVLERDGDGVKVAVSVQYLAHAALPVHPGCGVLDGLVLREFPGRSEPVRTTPGTGATVRWLEMPVCDARRSSEVHHRDFRSQGEDDSEET